MTTPRSHRVLAGRSLVVELPRVQSRNGPRPRTSLNQLGRPVTCTGARTNRGGRSERHRSRGLSGIGISRISYARTVTYCARAGAVGVEGVCEGQQSHLVTGKLHGKIHLVCAAKSCGFQERPRARRTCPARDTIRRGYRDDIPGIVQRVEYPGLGSGIVRSKAVNARRKCEGEQGTQS